MKIKVNYDFTQQELIGRTDIFEIADGTKLRELLRIVDTKMMDAGKNKRDTIEFVYGFCGG